ncbi:GrpB family protein [Humibacillus xanthopallidus]|uniref:GrpB-like predicted nucleotidyltransferase (UPF0157 family) n=1 Tax=Humibacillus xanthopallidus TaxID=412689 RepID=A0A543HX80_9MICO|nr:GrpB family protein [Humibacillus xanthopallidus]TQM62899.1 GrpB-like predicted nucleotidyltransferase (UPF0157 family) [Humibacillus xanthopallidus]
MGDRGRYPDARLVAPDPAWPRRYAVLVDALGRALGPDWALEHVGSTSVPGLVAKPVIDIAIRIPPGVSVDDASSLLAPVGWSDAVAVGDHWAVFLLDDGVRLAIGHLFEADRWPEAHVRLFAQWLRRHPADRERYAELKTSLVAAGVWGEGYTDAKVGFVRGVVERARAAHGLPPVSGPL